MPAQDSKRKQLAILKELNRLNSKQLQHTLSKAKKPVFQAIVDATHNVCCGNCDLPAKSFKKLKRRAPILKQILNRRLGFKRKSKLIVEQSGGILPFIIPAAIGLLGSIVGEGVASVIRR